MKKLIVLLFVGVTSGSYADNQTDTHYRSEHVFDNRLTIRNPQLEFIHTQLSQEQQQTLKNVDAELLAIGAVDSNFVYKDMDKAQQYFAKKYTMALSELPSHTQYAEQFFQYTPLHITHSFPINMFMDLDYLTDSEITADMCRRVYIADYYRANNVTLKIQFINTQSHNTTAIILDNKRCKDI